ncbi:hypothetical protein Vadar_010061 [Vaccinium darrowii]|uniref:Uncharacterized protein n=1 Tax=Vaccinium darrowii TaxID=229202 RepID=A0ACB7Y689_9ERIC|nr:hypothetical protein Vadar_010061 [Vaccinium darrowii]
MLFESNKLSSGANRLRNITINICSCCIWQRLKSTASSTTSFSKKASRCKHTCPWVCHFHISKEMAKKRTIRVHSIIDALNMNWKCASTRSKTDLPKFQIKRANYSVADMQKENSATFCIAVTIVEGTKNPAVEIDNLRDMMILFLPGTVVKGFLEFKKVDIVRKDEPNVSTSHRSSPGELYLKVFMSEHCERQILECHYGQLS